MTKSMSRDEWLRDKWERDWLAWAKSMESPDILVSDRHEASSADYIFLFIIPKEMVIRIRGQPAWV